MLQRTHGKRLRGLFFLIALTILAGCSSVQIFHRNGEENNTATLKNEQDELAPYEKMRPEEVLQVAPGWMREAHSLFVSGDSSNAEKQMMQAILGLQSVLLDVPEETRPVLLDTLETWSGTYRACFEVIVDDMVATDEGVAVLMGEEEKEFGEDLIDEITTDTTEVVFDPTILEDSLLPSIPDTLTGKVERMIEYFSKNKRGRKSMQRWLERAEVMIPRMAPILKEHGVPTDLVYLSMIESGFRTDARSWARAVGPWQFIYSTGRTFDLSADWWYDQRRDPEMATHAAARFLRQLYDHLGHWYLALSAYNCGEGRVRRDIRRCNSRDFWKLYKLPRQTRNYVPTFLAAREIAKNPEKYGFKSVRYRQPEPYDEVTINEPVELTALAKALDVSLQELRDMNPALMRWCVPPNRTGTVVKVPAGKGAEFETAFAKIPDHKKTSWVRHQIGTGETLSTIATKYHTSMRAIMDVPANNIKNPNRISVGKYLLIPVAPGGKSGDYSYLYAANDPELPPGTQKRVYRVRSGDTLSQIADRHHIGLSKLCRWNNLSKRSIIQPGQKLVLYQPERATVTASHRGDVKGGTTGTSSSMAATPASGAPEGKAPAPLANVKNYRVQYGDSPWKIARMYGISTEDLLAANNRTKDTTLIPGETLRIPLNNRSTKDTVVYQVRRGDTLWEIAQRFEVSVNDLKRWNDFSDSRQLYPGDQLIIRLKGA